MNSSKNTKRRSILTFVITPSEKKGWYTAFCFELGLVREGKDVLKLKERITKLAFDYYKSVVQHNLNDELLNQTLPGKYQKIIKKIEKEIELKEKWEKIVRNILWKYRAQNGKLHVETPMV